MSKTVSDTTKISPVRELQVISKYGLILPRKRHTQGYLSRLGCSRGSGGGGCVWWKQQ